MQYENENDIGIVQEIISQDTARILIKSRGECGQCAGKESCSIMAEKNSTIMAKYDQSLRIGEEVYLLVKPGNRILSALLIFLFPLLTLFSGYYWADYLFKKESAAILFSFAAFLLSFGIIFLLTKKLKFLKEISCWVRKKELSPDQKIDFKQD